MDQENSQKELSEFQIRNIKILTHLLKNDAVSDDVIDDLHLSELDYFSLLNKYKLLEVKVNIDEKTNLLKFKKDYLTNIIKTASRIYFGMKAKNYFISFIRFDIDDFSHFNNEYGHDVGDKVLTKIAGIIRDNSRPTDYVIRFGGEEIDVILPSTEMNGALVYVNKIIDQIRSARIDHNGQKLGVTVSAGLSHLIYTFEGSRIVKDDEVEKYFEELQKQADNALYEAKQAGKDRYSIYDPEKEKEYEKIRKAYMN